MRAATQDPVGTRIPSRLNNSYNSHNSDNFDDYNNTNNSNRE